MSDYYEILDIEKDSNQVEIKAAYRRLAKKYHPDLNNGDEEAQEKFKEINEAYEVLSDEEKRQRYDMYGKDGLNGNGYGFGDIGDIFGDIFEGFFGGGFSQGRTQSRGPRRGADIRYDVDLDFMEAVFGVEEEIELTKPENCSKCNGSGAMPGTEVHQCETCHGTGQVRFAQQSPFGQVVRTAVCDDCGGTGEIIEEKCDQCNGTGQEVKTKKIKINIPKGVNNGSRIRVANEGYPGELGGPTGDLYIFINVREHELFERDGYDIYYTLPISFVDATLGAEIEIAALDRMMDFTIPEGTQPGKIFKLKNEGVHYVNSDRKGDLYIKVEIEIPTKINDEQREALKNYADISGEEHREGKKKGFFEKLKDSFIN